MSDTNGVWANCSFRRRYSIGDTSSADLRNNTVSDLKAEADDLVKEVRRLSDDVAHALQSSVHDDMLPTVERLLELKPQHRQANDLYEQLFSNNQVTRPARNKSSRGKSKTTASVDPKLLGGGVLAVVILICLLLFWPGNDPVSDEQTVADPGTLLTGTVGSSAVNDSLMAASSPARSKQVAASAENPSDDRQLIRNFLKANHRGTSEEFFVQFDKNDDRRLGQTEISLKMIDRFDQSDDRNLDLEEVRAIFDQMVGRPRGPGGDNGGNRSPKPEDRLPLENPPFNDGRPGENRPGRGPGGRPEDLFDRHDQNGDGIIDGDEVPPFFTDDIDRNDDGQITFDELRRTMKELGPDAFIGGPSIGEGGRPRLREGGSKFPRPRD